MVVVTVSDHLAGQRKGDAQRPPPAPLALSRLADNPGSRGIWFADRTPEIQSTTQEIDPMSFNSQLKNDIGALTWE